MTAATSALALDGASVSFSTIDAIVSTSYGVRFLRLRVREVDLASSSRRTPRAGRPTSCVDVVFARKSYVAGKRKPSRFVRRRGVKHGTTAASASHACRYGRWRARPALPRLRSAILATALTRSAIWRAREALGEDDAERLRRRRRRRRRRVRPVCTCGSATSTATTASTTAATIAPSATRRRRRICSGDGRGAAAAASRAVALPFQVARSGDARRRARRRRRRAPR